MDVERCKRCGLFAAVFGISAAFAVAQTTDWSQVSGDVTIPAGETWYAEESDMATVNGLTSITVSGAVTGDNPVEAATLVFRNTTTVPKAGLLLGAGIVRKSGLSVWANYANAQTSFTGDWHLDGGVVTNTATGAFGKINATTVGKLYIHDGAALVLRQALRILIDPFGRFPVGNGVQPGQVMGHREAFGIGIQLIRIVARRITEGKAPGRGAPRAAGNIDHRVRERVDRFVQQVKVHRGDVIYFRWTLEPPASGNSALMAIDDLTVTFSRVSRALVLHIH